MIGFHQGTSLGWGRFLYVEDLATHTLMRGRGHASALCSWIEAEAARLRCDQVHLDSAGHRHDAHRLYLNNGFELAALHFAVRDVR